MRRALALAATAAGTTRPNPAVGAVVVREGRIIGEGHTAPGGRPHGETEAIRLATEPTLGATMYVTLEPCNHTGRTGPCSEAIIAAGIARVIIAARDPNIAARGGVERLRDAGVEVHAGLLAAEAKLINPAFHTFHELGRPLVTLKWAMTLDGATSTSTGDSKWITDEAARHRAHEMRAAHDAVVAESARSSPMARA
jgi:diaminohydroxyphosphoribosylaminopyrimidine deaminase/5-amino-6-(5-phosphoribosylamino)uracil reductase